MVFKSFRILIQVLAVGIDNIFILVHPLDRVANKNQGNVDRDAIIASVLAEAGPSMFTSTLAQVAAFLLGEIQFEFTDWYEKTFYFGTPFVKYIEVLYSTVQKELPFGLLYGLYDKYKVATFVQNFIYPRWDSNPQSLA